MISSADPLSDYLDSKQSRESVDLSATCHSSRNLITFAFRSCEVWRLLLGLVHGTDPLGVFAHFLKRTADVLDV